MQLQTRHDDDQIVADQIIQLIIYVMVSDSLKLVKAGFVFVVLLSLPLLLLLLCF